MSPPAPHRDAPAQPAWRRFPHCHARSRAPRRRQSPRLRAERPHRRRGLSNFTVNSSANPSRASKARKPPAAIRASVKLDFVFIGEGGSARCRRHPWTLLRQLHRHSRCRGRRQRRPRRRFHSGAHPRQLRRRDAPAQSTFTASSPSPTRSPCSDKSRPICAIVSANSAMKFRALLLITEIRIRANKRASFPSKPNRTA